MAVEVEAAGQVDEFLRVLRRRIWWIIIPFVVIGSFGTFFAVVVPKKFVSRTKIMVRNADEETGQLGKKASAVEGKVAKYNIMSNARIDTVLTKLRWPDYQALTNPVERREYREDLTEDLSVYLENMPAESDQQLVEIKYMDVTAERATTFLSALKKSWVDEVLQRHLARAQTDLTETNEKLSDLRKSRDNVTADIRQLRLEHEIAPVINQRGRDDRSNSPASFNEQEALEERIAKLEFDIDEQERSLEDSRLERDEMPPRVKVSRTDTDGNLQENLDRIDKSIQRLQDTIDLKGWSSSHTSYRLYKKQIEDLKDKKQQLITQSQARVNLDGADEIDNPDRITMTKEIDKLQRTLSSDIRQKESLVGRLRDVRRKNESLQNAFAKLSTFEEDLKSLNGAIDGLNKRAANLDIQVSKLSSVDGNPFEVQEEPTEASKPTAPNPWFISIGSLIFGLGLGLGLAVLKEYSRSCFRSGRELSRVMTHPVLGTINSIRTRRERARAFLVRGVLGGGSLLFALAVGYVTWAWSENKDALTEPLANAIDNFRKLLM